MRQTPYIGRRYPRVEDWTLLRGVGRFVDDLNPPGLLEAAFLRSSTAHGLIRSIDTSAARALPGVHAVYTLADLRQVLTADRLPLQFPSNVLPADISPFILAGSEVSYVGEAIVLVVADTRYIAEDALALIEMDIQELPAASDCRDALSAGAPDVHVHRKGNLLIDFVQSLWRCGGSRGGSAPPPGRESQAASRRRTSDRGPRTCRKLRCRERSVDRLELDTARARSPLFHNEDARAR